MVDIRGLIEKHQCSVTEMVNDSQCTCKKLCNLLILRDFMVDIRVSLRNTKGQSRKW